MLPQLLNHACEKVAAVSSTVALLVRGSSAHHVEGVGEQPECSRDILRLR